jgi:hypothetical protein
MGAYATNFYIYLDADSPWNHGFPSGFFANPESLIGQIQVATDGVNDFSSPTGHSSDPNVLDRERGTVLSITFPPLKGKEFAGVNVQDPESGSTSGRGYDLRGTRKVFFDARTTSPEGMVVDFRVNQRRVRSQDKEVLVYLPPATNSEFYSMEFELAEQSLEDVSVIFTAAVSATSQPSGVTSGGAVVLDNIRLVPAPTNLLNLGFPIANQTFGVLARRELQPGRVPIPLDQANRNSAPIYESALAALAFWLRASEGDWASLRTLADSFSYALRHDNSGLPIPHAPDGSRALHSVYSAGPLALWNSQGPGKGNAGEVRLGGYSGPCSGGYCLVGHGTTGGNLSFAVISILAAYNQFGDPKYLEDAREIASWIRGTLKDTNGFGGYFLGHEEGTDPSGPALVFSQGKSTENNADIFRALRTLAETERRLGNLTNATILDSEANHAGDFVLRMWDSAAGRFNAGTVLVGTPSDESRGVRPNGDHLGNDVVNTFDYLDANTFSVLSLSADDRYALSIDWRRPVRFAKEQFHQKVTANGLDFEGFSLLTQPTAGPPALPGSSRLNCWSP